MTIADDRSSKRKRKREALIEFRRAVLARAKVPGGWKCERCKRMFRYETLIHAHHRVPRSQGGSNCITNGAALCGGPGGCHELVHDANCDDWRDWLVTRNTLRIER